MFSEYYNGCVVFEPPEPIKKSDYLCSTRFEIDELLDMLSTESCFGIVLTNCTDVNIFKLTIKKNYHKIDHILSKTYNLTNKKEEVV